jgi:hypothetical protein
MVDEPIPDLDFYEQELLSSRFALGDSGGQGFEGHYLDLALDVMKEAKFLKYQDQQQGKDKGTGSATLFF